MKKLFIIFLAAISCYFVNAQSVGIGTNTPNAKALLDISSTTKGVLLPRMTTSQRFDITTPPNGLVVYDTDKNEFYHHDGLSWKALLNSDYWRRPITSRKRISNLNDSVGINLSGATEWLDVDGNIRSRNNLIVGNNVTAQGNITGGSFSTGGNMLIAGTSLLSGDVTTNSDITINNTAAILQLKSSNVNKGFLQLSGNDVRFGTNSGNTSGDVIVRMDGDDRFKFEKSGRMTLLADATPTIYLATGGVTQAFMQVQGNNLRIQATSNKVHINNDLTVDDATGRVGIGTTTPEEKLHIHGKLKVTGTGMTIQDGRITGTNAGTGYNLLPACYGRVDYVGSKNSGTNNFTCTRLSEGVYDITSPQLNSSSVMIANPEWAYNMSIHHFTTRAYHVSGNTFRVLIFETWNDLVHDCRFSFIAYTY